MAAPGTGRVNAVVLDAHERHSLVAVRCLGKAGLTVGSLGYVRGAPAFSSRWSSVTEVVPDPAADPGGFVEAVIATARNRGVQAVISVSDGTIDALRAGRGELERHARLALGSDQALALASDKRRTLALAAELRVPVPATVSLRREADIAGAVRKLGLPLVVKPARSWNQVDGVGVRLGPRMAATNREARALAKAVWHSGGEPILQEWVRGRREAISLLRDGGAVKARFAQVNERMYPPLGGSTVLRRSIPLPPDSTGYAERLAAGCELEGYCEVEFRRGADGAPVLMEINPRLSAAVELAVRCGIDFPLLLYRWAIGERIEPVSGYRTGLRMRWLGGDLRRLEAVLAQPRRPDVESRPAALASFALDFLRPARYDYLALRDPTPALVAARVFIASLAKDVLMRRRP